MSIYVDKSGNVDERINRISLLAIWIIFFGLGAYGIYDGELKIWTVASVFVFLGLCTILIIRKMKSAKR